MSRFIRPVFLSVALLLAASAAFAQTTGGPPTLEGEFLVASGGDVRNPRGTITIEAQCDPQGQSTITFHATGPAVGPYPGTYTESGTIIVGPQTLGPNSHLVGPATFTATFTIQSAVGTVTGTKQSTLPIVGSCENTSEGNAAQLVSGTGVVDYTARLDTAVGAFRATGQTQVDVSRLQPLSLEIRRFNEIFLTSTLVPLSTPGHATGGGRVGAVTFGFEAFSRIDAAGEGPIEGGCNVVDRSGAHVRCLDVDSYVQTGNQAVFTGPAEVDGTPTRYRIEVVDGGEGSGAVDTFAITTDSGYAAGGPVTQGNVQVHPTR